MHARSLCSVLTVLAICTPVAMAQNYDFSFDEEESDIQRSLSLYVPFEGTLIGNYDEKTNPEGTRTVPGIFGGSGNNPIGYSAAFGLSGSNASAPSGNFSFEVESGGLIGVMSGFELDVLGSSSDSLDATLYLLYETFRTFSPTSLFPGGVEIPIPLGEIELTSLTMTQSLDAVIAIIPGDGDGVSTIAGVLPVEVSFQVAVLGQEIGGIPLPMLLPVAGSFVENDNGAQIVIEAAFDYDEALPSTGIPFENIPIEMPTLLPPGSFASLLMSGADSEGSTAGSWNIVIVADADSASCADDPDINGDGVVNGADLTIVLANWDAPGGPADVNCDGIVNGEDLTIVLGNWSS